MSCGGMCGENEHCEHGKCLCGEYKCMDGYKCEINHEGEKECKGNCLQKKLILGENEAK